MGSAIKVCGAKNVFFDAPTRVSQVSFESVVRKNPDLIVAYGKSSDAPTQSRKKWQGIGWGHKLRFVDATELLLPTLRFATGLRKLCSALDESK